jgi:hypothetical protein
MLSPDGAVGDVPQEHVNDAVNQGGFKIAQDMISPDGQEGVIPLDQVHAAVARGFQLKPPAPQKPTVPAMEEAPEATGALGTLKQAVGRFFSEYQAGTTEENKEAAYKASPEGKANEAAEAVLGMGKALASDAAKASAPNVFLQLYKHLKGEPNDLKSIPASAVMTFLAAAGDPETEGGAIRPVADTTAEAVRTAGKVMKPVGRASATIAGRLTGISQGWEAFKNALEGHAEAEDAADEVAGTTEPAPGSPRAAATAAARKAILTGSDPEVAAREAYLKAVESPEAQTQAKASSAAKAAEKDYRQRVAKPGTAEDVTETAASRKAAAEQEFLKATGLTKEQYNEVQLKHDVAQAKAEAKYRIKPPIDPTTKKPMPLGPRGGLTPEIREVARQDAHAARLKHITKLTGKPFGENEFQAARGSSFRGAVMYDKAAMDRLLRPEVAHAPTGVASTVAKPNE